MQDDHPDRGEDHFGRADERGERRGDHARARDVERHAEPEIERAETEEKGEVLRADGKGLVGTDGGAGQVHGAFGNVELVAMPMEHGDAVQFGEGRGQARIGKRERRKADFLDAQRVDPGAQRSRNELRAQADAQQRLAAVQPAAHGRQLLGDEGIKRLVIGTYGSAQHDEQVGTPQVQGVKLADAGIDVLHFVAAAGELGMQGAQVFEVDVAQRDGFFHGRNSGGYRRVAWNVRSPSGAGLEIDVDMACRGEGAAGQGIAGFLFPVAEAKVRLQP